MNKPYTRAELAAMIKPLTARLAETELDFPAARPLPPLSQEECLGLHERLMDHAGARPLTREEIFLAGQVLAQLCMAVRAEMLGLKGRFFCVSEDDVLKLVDKQ